MGLLQSLTLLAVLFMLCSTYLIRFRLELRSQREQENTKYLTADLKARNESDKLAIEKDKSEILVATLKNGHSPGCSYCSCGVSNRRSDAEKALKTAGS
jgi:hypothetical protein